MRRTMVLSLLALSTLLALTSLASAQVNVRAPFVRVDVGPGVAVRVPFVNLWIPRSYPYYPPPGSVLPPPTDQNPPASPVAPPVELAPPPKPIRQVDIPPPPQGTGPALTLEQFAKTFQPKPGAYDVEILNPQTNQPTRVRFTLPEGTPKNVQVRRDEIEFRYSLLRFVRIEFDKDGAKVISR